MSQNTFKIQLRHGVENKESPQWNFPLVATRGFVVLEIHTCLLGSCIQLPYPVYQQPRG